MITNTGALNALTGALGSFNERLTNVKPGSGQTKFNRVMDTLFGGPSDYDAAKGQVSGLNSAAIRLSGAKDAAQAARRDYAAKSWRHPLDKLEEQRRLGNAMQNELAEQEKYTAGRPIGPMSPDLLNAGRLYPRSGTPSGALSPMGYEGVPTARLEGQAVITNKIEVDLSPGLVERTVRQAISASGNLRSDTGVSMPQSMMPY
jgi:hypothetical protein